MAVKKRSSSRSIRKIRRHAALHREVFAAAFVRDFFQAYDLFATDSRMRDGWVPEVAKKLDTDPLNVGPFDIAAHVVSGERAWTIADLAVAEYARWKKENGK